MLGPGSPSAQEGLATDGHTSTGARWDQATAKVYLDPAMDETFTLAYKEALESWNQTGAFTFQLVTSEEEADILLTEMDDSTVSAAGEAETQTNVLTNRFKRVIVRLNRYYLLNKQYNYSHQRIVNTAEHELGHAIGLDHNEEESVMQAAGSFYSIQARDIEAVRRKDDQTHTVSYSNLSRTSGTLCV
ncbi:MAG: matrixin family metalloprotease [Veillonella sp.]